MIRSNLGALHTLILESLHEKREGPDILLIQAVYDINDKKLFAEETLQDVHSLILAGMNRLQSITMRREFIAKDESKVKLLCRYSSLFSDCAASPGNVTMISYGTIINIINFAEGGGFDNVASSPEQRVGAANAVIALKNKAVSRGKTTQELADQYRNLLAVFAEHHDDADRLHLFIEERGLTLGSDADSEALRLYADSDATALASGSL